MQQDSRWNLITNLFFPIALILGLVLLLSLNVSDASPTESSSSPLEDWLKLLVGYLAAVAEIAAAIVIGGAVVRGIGEYLKLLFSRRHRLDNTETIRLQLGRVLALGLEFTVASDILRTAVAPTRQDILNLGAIVLLRTLLNYFLEREIQQGEQHRLPKQTPEQNAHLSDTQTRLDLPERTR